MNYYLSVPQISITLSAGDFKRQKKLFIREGIAGKSQNLIIQRNPELLLKNHEKR